MKAATRATLEDQIKLLCEENEELRYQLAVAREGRKLLLDTMGRAYEKAKLRALEFEELLKAM